MSSKKVTSTSKGKIDLGNATDKINNLEKNFMEILADIKLATPHFLNIIDLLSKGKFSIFFNFKRIKNEFVLMINVFKKADDKVKSLNLGYKSVGDFILDSKVYSEAEKL